MSTATNEPGAPVLVRVSDIKAEMVSWLWPGVLPLGKLVTLDGDPGLGKSTLSLDIAARLSCGGRMPDGSPVEVADIIVLTGEDGLADTVRPRLDAAGADVGRIHVMTAVRNQEGRPDPPSLPEHVEALRRAIRETKAKLVIVDPIMGFLSGRIDSHRDQDVRGVLRPLSELAEQELVCIIVIRHLRKTAAGNPLYRGSGSIAFIGAARVGLIVGPDPEDSDRRLLCQAKNNLAPLAPSLTYRVVTAGMSSRIEWGGTVSTTAADLMAEAEGSAEGRGGRDEAEDFLREVLADGPVPLQANLLAGPIRGDLREDPEAGKGRPRGRGPEARGPVRCGTHPGSGNGPPVPKGAKTP